MLDGQIDMYL